MSALRSGQQEQFVRNLLDGMSQRRAYRDAYPASRNWKDKNVDSAASKLYTKVLPRYQELQAEAATPIMMSYEFKREKLKECVDDRETSASDKLKAIDLDNKMTGVYVNRVEVSHPIDDSIKEMEAYLDGSEEADVQPPEE